MSRPAWYSGHSFVPSEMEHRANYSLPKGTEGMNETLSSHDHGNCELCDLIEVRLKAAERQSLELYAAGQLIDEARLALKARLEALERFVRWCIEEVPSGQYNNYQMEGSNVAVVDPDILYALREWAEQLAATIQEEGE